MPVEADFQREYRIDLVQELQQMTWRRFVTLVRGLSADSATAHAYRALLDGGPEQEVIVLTTEEEVMAARAAMFGPAPTARA